MDVGPVRVWISYRTPVAFQVDGHSRVVRQNDWSTTTGKHLNWIDGGDKKSRVDGETFERLWKEQVEPRLNPHFFSQSFKTLYRNSRTEQNGTEKERTLKIRLLHDVDALLIGARPGLWACWNNQNEVRLA